MVRSFGKKINSYTFKKNVSLISIIGIGSILAFIIIYGIDVFNKAKNKIDIIPLIIILLVSSIVFVFIILFHLINLTRSFIVFERGFVYKTLGINFRYPIEDIKSIYYDTFKYYNLSNKYLVTVGEKNMDISLKILLNNGKKILLKSGLIKNFAQLNEDINDVFTMQNLEKLNDSLLKDGSVKFGEISISGDRYIFKDKDIKFSDIDELYIKDSILHILLKDNLIIKMSIKKIPDLFLMIELSRKLLLR
ncbi:MAG: hypothetical protein FWC47_14270 [Oscillospiraceae bacterium]|nr:hypothetical protein [Oscillospiraceae bacterium]